MDYHDVIRVLDEMADLLELSEENPYKARAYRKAGQALRENPGYPLDDPHSLTKIPGIGESLAKVITELAATGKSAYHQELKDKVPVEFRKLLRIPGLGPKTVRLILREIQPQNLDQLEKALANREIRKIKGLSSKTEAKLKRGLEMLQDRSSQFSLGIALPLGRELVNFLETLPGVTNAAVVGSTIRGRECVKDLDLVVGCRDAEGVAKAFAANPNIELIEVQEEQHVRGVTWFGLTVDVYLVPPEVYATTREHLSGHIGHHAKLRELGKAKGLNWKFIPDEAYAQLGLPVFPVELREEGVDLKVPENLLKSTDIRGDLHMHTRWSDGGHSIKEMAAAAADKGYEYIAICDHSRNLAIARGLKPEQLKEQRQEIAQVNEEFAGRIKVLAGAETDILKDGSLDFPDEVLSELDVVVASVHMRYKQDIEEMTERIERALKNPHVDILAHPTGRLIGKRDPFGVHLERVFEMAAKNKKALEINASPSRLDLKDEYAAMARDLGIPIVIDTDAHSVEELDDMEYGVMTARRAALRRDEVLNTKPLAELERWLHRC